jgi:DNA replication and repair protein RecF
VLVLAVKIRDFRGYERASACLGSGLTVVWGPNGAGKTNLLEAVYFGCTGYSCRTTNERELIRFGAGAARVEVQCHDLAGDHELAVGIAPGQPKRMSVDGASVPRMLDSPHRPLLSFFSPDRLELIKGAPALRRAHVDQFVTAMWPARSATRRAYSQTLAQRNSLLQRIRGGRADRSSLGAWDSQLAVAGIGLMEDRSSAVASIAGPLSEAASRLGLAGELEIAYRPRSHASDATGLAAELSARLAADLDRGFTTHGPHRDEIQISHNGRELRNYGSQGQQRLALLALLLSERDALARTREAPPVLLLDDVMSELDSERRSDLVALLHSGPGQAMITTTDLDQVPDAGRGTARRLAVRPGQVLGETQAA